jgi:Protein of unknown function (DUF3592)
MKLFYLAGGIGVVLTLVGLWRLVANFRFLARSTAVEGKLVNWDVTAAGKVGGPTSKDGRNSYRPIVSFRAVDGSEHRVMGSAYRQAFHKPDVPGGSPYPVRYDASNPSDAQVVTFADFWLFPLASLGVGIVSLVFAMNAAITNAA